VKEPPRDCTQIEERLATSPLDRIQKNQFRPPGRASERSSETLGGESRKGALKKASGDADSIGEMDSLS
jgi:hypothetical protein